MISGFLSANASPFSDLCKGSIKDKRIRPLSAAKYSWVALGYLWGQQPRGYLLGVHVQLLPSAGNYTVGQSNRAFTLKTV